MIIEYSSRPAKCKDCIYCGYYYPIKKDGNNSNYRRHKCKLTNKTTLLNNRVCDKWIMGCGVPDNFNYIKVNI